MDFVQFEEADPVNGTSMGKIFIRASGVSYVSAREKSVLVFVGPGCYVHVLGTLSEVVEKLCQSGRR
jgi:hypothetical protein